VGKRGKSGIFSSVQRAVGYDYGTKPKVMVMGDMEFPSLLGDSYLALAYAVEPQFGALVDAPMLVMVFENEAAGRACFARFGGWCEASGSGDAVALGFVEVDDAEYVMCIYPDHERLVQRALPETHRPEVDPLVFMVGHSKTFPRQSGGYDWFKRAAGRSPFVLAPATPDGSVMIDAAFYKTEVGFYREDDLPEHSMELALMRLRRGEEDAYGPKPPEAAGPEEITERRWAQLSRFFPVTLERLSFDTAFGRMLRQLTSEGYREWQVMQAGCNLTLRSYAPELFSSGEEEGDSPEELNRADILDYLLDQSEDAMGTFPPTGEMTAPVLREQITADGRDLLSYVAGPDTPDLTAEDLQAELASRGLLEA
jgi:hypothetical protein